MKDTVDPETVQQLHALLRKSEDTFKKGDAAARGALFTEDGVLVTEHGPVYGGQAIEKFYADLFQNVHFIDLVLKYAQNSPYAIGTAGNDVYDNGEWSCTISLQGQSGDPIQLHGYFAAVKVREGDTWKIRLDAIMPAAPAETR